MKRKVLVITMMVLVCVQLSACTNPLQPTCKESGCDETNINDDGYCNVHSIEHAIENKAKDLFN
jgi:hypothetical protein